MGKTIKSGDGWRLGWHPEAPLYPGLVGGEDWGFELTAPEFEDFRRLLMELGATMAAIAEELMEEERITCEAESDLLWLEVEGFPHRYTLRIIVTQQRACEGAWSAIATQELLRAVQLWEAF